MVGSIDPRCETLRGTHWPVKVAVMFGTRVAENHLGQRSTTASTGRTYGCKRSDQTFKKLLRHGGRPHMGPCVRRDDPLKRYAYENSICDSPAARGERADRVRSTALDSIFKQPRRFRCKTVIASAAIAVGTLIAERPPHRTVRAAFPHTAPTLGA